MGGVRLGQEYALDAAEKFGASASDLRAIATSENGFEGRLEAGKPIRKFKAGQAIGHDEVGDQQIDLRAVLAPNFQSGFARRGLKNIVTHAAQNAGRQRAHRILILDKQDGFVTALNFDLGDLLGVRRHGCQSRQENPEGSAQADLGGHLDPTLVLFDYAIGCSQTDSFVVKKGSKMRGRCSGTMPVPVSRTMRQTNSPLLPSG